MDQLSKFFNTILYKQFTRLNHVLGRAQ